MKYRYFIYTLLFIMSTFGVYNNSYATSDFRCVPEFKLPDQWITTYVGPQTPLYTRTFTFLDIVNDELYDVKNNTTYYVWCLDQNMPIATGYLNNVWLYNLDEDLPDDLIDVAKGIVTIEDFFRKDYNNQPIEFDKILYIINNRDGYGKPEVQEAIWYYSMGAGNFVPTRDPCCKDKYLELVNAAEAHGDGYIPPPGGKWILFAYTITAEDTPHLPEGTIAQPFIMEIDIPECTLTKSQGYWKTHPDQWPVDELVLGDRTYSKSKLLRILKRPPKGDASVILAKQLIAAKLNVLSGAKADDDIIALINQADDLISSNCNRIPCYVWTRCSLGQEMIELARQLEEYNNSENEYCKCYYSEEEPSQPPQNIGKCKKYKKKYMYFKKKYRQCIKNMCSPKCIKYKKKYLQYFKKYKQCKKKHHICKHCNSNDNDNGNHNWNGNNNDNSNSNLNDNDNDNYNWNSNNNDNSNSNGNYNDNDNSNSNSNNNCNNNSNYNGNDD